MSRNPDGLEAHIRECLGKDQVSFAELSRIEGFSGNFVLRAPNNAIIWAGVSAEAADIIARILASEEYTMKTTLPITYLIDGGGMNFPLAKDPHRKHYSQNRWQPVIFVKNPKFDAKLAAILGD